MTTYELAVRQLRYRLDFLRRRDLAEAVVDARFALALAQAQEPEVRAIGGEFGRRALDELAALR